MVTHKFTLTYDGLDATDGRMPPSIVKQIETGAQELLGATAYYYTKGRIPEHVLDHTRDFRIHDLRERYACWEATFLIEFFQEFSTEYGKTLGKGAGAATVLGFGYILRQAYHAWKHRKSLDGPLVDRIEPVLTDVRGNGAPIIDLEREQRTERERLLGRVQASMSKLTAPLGRVASTLQISFDDKVLDVLRDRISMEDAITQYVRQAARQPGRERRTS